MNKDEIIADVDMPYTIKKLIEANKQVCERNKHLQADLKMCKEALEGAEHALAHTMDFCLCNRDTGGFDYGEGHKYQGKPAAGKRWLVPSDVSNIPLECVRKTLSKLNGGEG